MKTILVKDLLKLDTLGFKIDIHIHGEVHEWEPVDEPMIRKLQKVYLKKEQGVTWLYWEWQEKDEYFRGYRDCGYSGMSLESQNIDKLFFNRG